MFVSHSVMKDRGSMCKFRKWNLRLDPRSFIPLWEQTSRIQSLNMHSKPLFPSVPMYDFYGRPGLIRRVWEHQNFLYSKLIEIVILWVYTIHFDFSLLFRHFWCITFQLFKLLCLAKVHWWGLSTWNAHMVHIVNLNGVPILAEVSLYLLCQIHSHKTNEKFC